MNRSSSAIPTEPLNTFKFYSGSQFTQTLRRLQTIRSAYLPAPRVIASHEHYNVIAIEWIHGRLLADLVARDRTDESLLFEVGCELARLHTCRPAQNASPATTSHDLNEIADYIGFICPLEADLATQTVNVTNARLWETRAELTMIHGDFYAKQVLVDGGTVRFIDFDQAGLGNPYQDIGNFVAKLYWQRLRLGQCLSHVEQMAEPFLVGYRSVNGNFDESPYRAHLAAELIRCATHPFRRAQHNWSHATRQLLLLAQNVLQSTKSICTTVTIA